MALKFSIIIPFYNAEKYISKTLKSIQDQTYTVFEAILVDDGSADSSPDICEDITKADNRFTLIRKKNAGVSAARNVGIRQAQGDYVLFIDSDDWLERNTLAICNKKLKCTNADELIFGMSFDIEKNGVIERSLIKTHSKAELESCDFAAAFRSLYICNYLTSSCNRVISLALLRTNNLFFDKRISNYEDYEFSLRVLGCCESVEIIPDVLYHYIIRRDSSNSRKYKPNMTKQLPVVCGLLNEDAQRITEDEKIRREIGITFQEVFWAGINNICKGPKPVTSLKVFCTQEWDNEKLPMVPTGNKYNDISLRFYRGKHWHLLYLWNKFAMLVRAMKY